MNTQTKEELLRLFLQEERSREKENHKQEGEFTVREYIKETGSTIQECTARKRLDALIAQGKISKRSTVSGFTYYSVVSTTESG